MVLKSKYPTITLRRLLIYTLDKPKYELQKIKPIFTDTIYRLSELISRTFTRLGVSLSKPKIRIFGRDRPLILRPLQ